MAELDDLDLGTELSHAEVHRRIAERVEIIREHKRDGSLPHELLDGLVHDAVHWIAANGDKRCKPIAAELLTAYKIGFDMVCATQSELTELDRRKSGYEREIETLAATLAKREARITELQERIDAAARQLGR